MIEARPSLRAGKGTGTKTEHCGAREGADEVAKLQPRADWRFGREPFELYVRHRCLMRGCSRIELSPTLMDLLLVLVERAGAGKRDRDRIGGIVVRKEELIEEVWAGRAIGDSVLTTTVHALRDKVGGIIETVHGVGHRLACPVEPISGIEEMRARYLTTLFVQAEAERQTMPDPVWDERYLSELDTVRSALDWALEEIGPDGVRPSRRHLAIALAGASARLWERPQQQGSGLSRVPEGRLYLDRCVKLLDDDCCPSDSARLLRLAGTLWREANRPHALSLLQRSSDLYRRLDDRPCLGAVLGLIGDTHVALGQVGAARVALQEAEKILVFSDQTKALWNIYNALGAMAIQDDAPREAMRRFGQALDLARELRDKIREGIAMLNMGDVEFQQGAVGRAIEHAKDAKASLRDSPASYRLRPDVNLATYTVIRRQFEAARFHATEALELAGAEGGYWLRLCLQVWALIAAEEKEYGIAARLMVFVDREFDEFKEARQLAERQVYARLQDILGTSVSDDDMVAWTEQGSGWSEHQAVEFVKMRLVRGSDREAVTTP